MNDNYFSFRYIPQSAEVTMENKMQTTTVDEVIKISEKQSLEEELAAIKQDLIEKNESYTKVQDCVKDVINLLLKGHSKADLLTYSKRNTSDINTFLTSRNENGIIFLLETALTKLNNLS